MPNKLQHLLIDRIDLVDNGANPDAHILLIKRDTRKGGEKVEQSTLMKFMHAIAVKLGFTTDEIAKMEDDKKMPMSTMEMMNQRKAEEEYYGLRYAFMDAMRDCMDMEDIEQRNAMMEKNVREYMEACKPIMARMHPEAMAKAQTELEDMDASFGDMAKMAEIIKAFAPEGRDKSTDNPPGKEKRSDQPVIKSVEDILKALPEDQRAVLAAELTKRAADDSVTKRLEELETKVAKAQTDATELAKKAADAETKLAKAEQDLSNEREIRIKGEYLAKAAKYEHLGMTNEEAADVLRKAEAAGIGEQIIKTWQIAETAIEKGNLFGSFGVVGKSQNQDAWARIEAKAGEIAKSANTTPAKALDQYLQTPEGKRDYADYMNEKEAN